MTAPLRELLRSNYDIQEWEIDPDTYPDLVGSRENDLLRVTTNSIAWGLDGDDIFIANSDYLNVLVGGNGDDTYILPQGSVNIIHPGSGFDRIVLPHQSSDSRLYILWANRDGLWEGYKSYYFGFYDPLMDIFVLESSASEALFFGESISEMYLLTDAGDRRDVINPMRLYWDDYPSYAVQKLEHIVESINKQEGDAYLDDVSNYLYALTNIIDNEEFIEPVPEISLSLEDYDLGLEPYKAIQIPVHYKNGSGQDRITGLSANIYFDSSVLKPYQDLEESEIFLLNVSLEDDEDLLFEPTLLDDTADGDGNLSTDKVLNLTWADLSPDSEGIEMPGILGNLVFAPVEQPIDSVTGMPLKTKVNIIPVEVPSNYQSVSSTTDIVFGELHYSLDVDGDGTTTALGDGLMIIRKLFNYAFTGDKLTNKAISPNATRTTEEIHAYLEDGIDNGFLDIDKDGSTTALGDGLMIIRYLFGAAFEGESLTSKALSNTSPFYDEPMAWSLVAEQIESLVPASPTL
jgi:hypothetical protein